MSALTQKQYRVLGYGFFITASCFVGVVVLNLKSGRPNLAAVNSVTAMLQVAFAIYCLRKSKLRMSAERDLIKNWRMFPKPKLWVL